MCTRPISINKVTPSGKSVEYLVPCGKCEECRAKLRNEVAALSVLEGEGKRTLSFMTMTYSQENLPLAISEEIDQVRRVVGFQRGKSIPHFLDKFKDTCQVVPLDDFVSVCPSLYRDDWKNHMKRFRRALDRASLSKDFSMLCFGEYGDKRKRPHFHALFYGLTPEHDSIFKSLWEKYFGECKVISVSRFNADGSDAFMRVSKYIAKYISKGDCLPDFVKEGFAEKPRRLSSVGFGMADLDVSKLRSFI